MARKIEVELIGDARSLKRAVNEADTSTGKLDNRFGKVRRTAGFLAAGLAGGLAVGLEKSVHQALEDEKATARLDQAFKNAGVSLAAHKQGLEDAEAAGRKLGFADDDVKNSVGSLITATGNYDGALRQLGIAQDLARFKGVSLETATRALVMANAGQTRALKQLGIDIPKVTTAQDALKASTDKHTGAAYQNALAEAKLQDKQATLANVLDTVTKKVHGQADAYSKTATGQMEQFKVQVQHLEEEVGKKLLPALLKVVGALNDLSGSLGGASHAASTLNEWIDKLHLGFLKWNIGQVVDELRKDFGPAATDAANKARQIAHAVETVAHWAEAAAGAVRDLISALGNIHVPHIHLPSIHLPGRARGGPVAAGSPYVVGEHGMELFVPSSSGTIVPNGSPAMAGAGGATYVLNAPNYVGDKQELFSAWRQEFVKFQNRGGKI